MKDRKAVIGRNIAIARKEKGWKQARLANEVRKRVEKIATTTISFYEQGRREPSADMLIVLADVLGTTVDYLVGRTSAPTPPAANIEDITGLNNVAVTALANMKTNEKSAINGVNRALPSKKAEEFFSALEKYTDGWSIQTYADMLVSIGPLGELPMEVSAEQAYQTAEGQSKMLVYSALNALMEDISIDPETAAAEREYFEMMGEEV